MRRRRTWSLRVGEETRWLARVAASLTAQPIDAVVEAAVAGHWGPLAGRLARATWREDAADRRAALSRALCEAAIADRTSKKAASDCISRGTNAGGAPCPD